MALSVPPPPHTTWDRTLPNPAALLTNGAEPRRTSSLLQHRISSDHFTTPAADDTGRSITIPYIAPLNGIDKRQAQSQTHLHGEQGFSRQRQDSAMSEDSITDISSEGTGPTENPPGYCLCVPEPKIPRPRNAFILYRQHQHAATVAQHPGLPNPDISKIIGEQWRQLSADDKNEWKALAEQEKARHSQQFPDYRYRPKRNGKYQSIEGSQGPISHPTNCSKCGGKTMNPPRTPHYPVFEHPAMTPVTGPPRGQKRGYAETQPPPPSARHPSLVQVAPPPYAAPAHYAYQPGRESVHCVTQPPPPPPAQQRMVIEDSEAKRRRLNQSLPLRQVYDQHYYDRERPTYHRESIARPMPPPIHRPSHPAPSMPPRGSQPIQRRDPSLTLPPLKTSAPVRPTTSPAQPPKSDVEGTIMTYPLLTKLKTLSSITLPLASPGSKSPPLEVRGVIIAVEGHDHARVEDMAASLSEQLEKEGRFYVRTFFGPNPYQAAAESGRRVSNSSNGELMSRAKYLTFMSEWHKVNQEVVDFVTRKPGTMFEVVDLDSNQDQDHDHEMCDVPLLNRVLDEKTKIEDPYERPGAMRSPISAVSPRTVERASEMTLDTANSKSSMVKQYTDVIPESSIRVTRSRVPQAALEAQECERQQRERYQAQQREQSRSPLTPPPPMSARPVTPPPPPSPKYSPKPLTTTAPKDISDLLPVAIIPHYQLTTVDTCAIALPITDNYDPLTHWRWHATLWRGCTGPDISVVIQSSHEEEIDGSGSDDGKKSNSRCGGVEGQGQNQSRGSGSGGSVPPSSAVHPPHIHAHVHSHPPAPGSTLAHQHQFHIQHSSHSSTNQHLNSHPTSTTSTTINNTTPANAPSNFNVDVRLQDHRAVIVRTRSRQMVSPRRGSTVDGNALDEKVLEKENENWEKAKRRVGFEVEEWMRR